MRFQLEGSWQCNGVCILVAHPRTELLLRMAEPKMKTIYFSITIEKNVSICSRAGHECWKMRHIGWLAPVCMGCCNIASG